MKITRILAGTLSLVAICNFTACGNEKEQDTPETTTTTEVITTTEPVTTATTTIMTTTTTTTTTTETTTTTVVTTEETTEATTVEDHLAESGIDSYYVDVYAEMLESMENADNVDKVYLLFVNDDSVPEMVVKYDDNGESVELYGYDGYEVYKINDVYFNYMSETFMYRPRQNMLALNGGAYAKGNGELCIYTYYEENGRLNVGENVIITIPESDAAYQEGAITTPEGCEDYDVEFNGTPYVGESWMSIDTYEESEYCSSLTQVGDIPFYYIP